MCIFSQPSAPSIAPPPPPEKPPAPAPSETSSQAGAASDAAKRAEANRRNRAQTILTTPSGLQTEASTTKKTLLGQ